MIRANHEEQTGQCRLKIGDAISRNGCGCVGKG